MKSISNSVKKSRLLQKNQSPGINFELLETTNIVINQCLLAHGKFILETLKCLSIIDDIIHSLKFYLILNEKANIWVLTVHKSSSQNAAFTMILANLFLQKNRVKELTWKCVSNFN